jgi:hypothetical protein
MQLLKWANSKIVSLLIVFTKYLLLCILVKINSKNKNKRNVKI